MDQTLKVKKNIKYFYLLTFLFDAFRSCFFGIGSLYYTEFLKLNLRYVFLIKMFSPITISLFELPSGIIADRFSRKLNFILSALFCSIGFFSYYFSRNFIHCIISEIFYSIGLAFYTGSLDALIISQLKSNKMPIEKVLSNVFAFSTLGLILGGVIGIIISHYYTLAFWLYGAIGMLVVALLTQILISNFKIENEIKEKEVPYKLNKFFILLALITISMSLVNSSFFNYWHTMLVRDLHISPRGKVYIIIYILYNLLISIGSISNKKINKIIKSEKLLFISVFSIIVSTIIMAITNNKILAILMFLLSELARGIELPTFFSIYNSIIPDKNRSFYLSLTSIISRATAIISLLTISIITSYYKVSGKSILLFSSSISLFFYSIAFILWYKEKLTLE